MTPPELYDQTMQDRREVELPYRGIMTNAVKPPERVSVVPLAHEDEAPVVLGVEFGVPLPAIVMPILEGTTMPEAQVQFPAGILTVSPSTAVCVGPLMTAFTLFRLQSAAV
jgi:hypothetical protein